MIEFVSSKGKAVMGTVAAAAGLGVVLSGLISFASAMARANWPTAPGRITGSVVAASEWTMRSRSGTRHRTVYTPQIQYEYAAGGRTYSGDRVSFGQSGSSGSQGFAQQVVDRYPLGREVSVHYNPSAPDESVLEAGLPGVVFLPIVVGLVLLLIGGAVAAANVGGTSSRSKR